MQLKKKSTRIVGLLAIIVTMVILAANTVLAQTPDPVNLAPLGAALAVGIAGLGAAIGMGMAGSAAIGAIVEKPDIFGKAFLFIVLIEAVAIYGLLVAILIVF
ncbi:MAG: ATP synthase subunit C [Candidatus Heimdallarchaeaceae archaeon]